MKLQSRHILRLIATFRHVKAVLLLSPIHI